MRPEKPTSPSPIMLTPEDQEVLLFAQDSMAGIPSDVPPEIREREEAEVVDFVNTFEGRERIMAAWGRDIAEQQVRGGWIDRVLASSGVITPETPQSPTLTPKEVARRFEKDGFVTRPPRFEQLIEDDSRTTEFQFDRQPSGDPVDQRGRNPRKTTEINGLRSLWGFLGDYVTKASPRRRKTDGRLGAEAKQAMSIRENLTFIGQQEFQEGTAGLAVLWKSYLDEDPRRQICVVTGASKLPQNRNGDKSDRFVRKAVLDNFDEEKDKRYLNRIVENVEDLTARPENARVVILDDWTVTGRQMFGVVNELLKSPTAQRYAPSMELNVIAAPKSRIERGLPLGLKAKPLKVRAYYEAYEAKDTGDKDVDCHITGAHSTTNFGFGVTVEELVKTMNHQTIAIGQKKYEIPALASVYRDYWRPSHPSLSRNIGREI
jgi:hypothetical protein